MPELSVVTLEGTIEPTVVLKATVLPATGAPPSPVSRIVSNTFSPDLASNTRGEIMMEVETWGLGEAVPTELAWLLE
jgi:hypothetical protein